MHKVHLDTDLGGDIDDLCALDLLLNWPDVEICGITTVTDNRGHRAGFTKYALQLSGKDFIPVKAGADVSLGIYRIDCQYQDERYWPHTNPVLNSIDEALELLRRSIEKGASIICIGPLTNLYLLDKRYPGILKKSKLFIMGGFFHKPDTGYPQWTQNDDFNIQVDIKSSEHVLKNSEPVLVPITETIKTYLRRSYLERLDSSNGLNKLIAKQAKIFADDEQFEEKYVKSCSKLPNDIINFQHDSLATAIALGLKDGVVFNKVSLKFKIKNTWLDEIADPNGQKYNVATLTDGDKFSKFWLEKVTSK